MDVLRRVSIIVAQHVLSGEKTRRRARKPNRLSTPSFSNSNNISNLNNDRERWTVSNEFNEDHFVRPQRRYFLPTLAGGLHLLSCYSMTYVRPSYHNPSHKVIFDFIQRLFKRANLTAGCSVICLIYVERLMNRTGLYLLRRNWRPIMLCSMLVASKMWQDMGCWNAEFSKIYPQFTTESIKRLERLFIAKLQWNTIISSGVYSKYYFALRSLNEKKMFRNKYLNMLGVRPNVPQARRIEIKSKKTAMVLSRSM